MNTITSIPLEHGLLLAAVLFALGLAGVILRRNLLFILMSAEIMMNATALAFVVAGARWGLPDGQVMFVLVLTTISYMQVFVPMAVMSQGGPLNSTRTIVLHIWNQAFQYLKMGYASALSVVLLLMLLGITLIQLRLLRTNWEY